MKWALLVALLSLSVQAQPAPRVALIVKGSSAELDSLTSSLRELLARLGVELGVDADLATVTADWSVSSECVLTVAQGTRIILLRRLPRGPSTAVTIENAAHITYSVIEELLEERKHPRAEVAVAPPPLVEEIVAPPPKNGPLALDLGGFFGGRAWGGNAPISGGGGLIATLSLAGGWRPSLTLLGEYHAPFETKTSLVSLRAQTLSLRLVPTVALLKGDSWRLDAGLGGGADIFFTSPSSTELPASNVSGARTDVTPIFTTMLAGHVAVAKSADVFLAFTLDVDLQPRRFLSDVSGSREEVFAPWRARPTLLLGFSFTAFGDDPFRNRIGGAP